LASDRLSDLTFAPAELVTMIPPHNETSSDKQVNQVIARERLVRERWLLSRLVISETMMPFREPASCRDLFGVLVFILVSFGYQSNLWWDSAGHKNAVLSV
jgi:hypothetical protein